MDHYKPYSVRIVESENTAPDVYEYDYFSQKLRNQLCRIIYQAIGEDNNIVARSLCDLICSRLELEYGVDNLIQKIEYPRHQPIDISGYGQLRLFLKYNKQVDECLDLIELCLTVIESLTEYELLLIKRKNIPIPVYDSWFEDRKKLLNNVVSEVNYRFQGEHVGYEFISGQIIRIDSKEVHNEVVKPALALIASDFIYNDANNNYRKGFEHYRSQNYDECVVSCSKAFEGCMKAICIKRKWTFDDKKDTASKLINICENNHLFPEYLVGQTTQLRCLMETVATPRNRVGAHASTTYTSTPKEVASYVLHFTASTIVFLIECELNLKG